MDGTDDAANWAYLLSVEKDVVYFYHVCHREGSFVTDFGYSGEFNSEYWRISSINLDNDRSGAFIKTGCLLIICAHCVNMLTGAEKIHNEYIKMYRECINTLIVESIDEKILVLDRELLNLCEFYITNTDKIDLSFHNGPFSLITDGLEMNINDIYQEMIVKSSQYWTKRGFYLT